MLYAQIHLTLPAWAHDAVDLVRAYADDAEKVSLAVELSRLNIDAQTGGPFGALVFGPDDRVVAAGVNVVLPQCTSLAHAENMAYMLAQQRLRRARLNENEAGQRDGRYTLATSSQPCCQCYGATIWAGIDRLLIGARSEDVMALTEFDEGPLPPDWIGELNRRGIEVVRDLQRDAACAVLRAYGQRGGRRY
jgi:tRNA(Arg) A34 adenosine deaminase TadA